MAKINKKKKKTTDRDVYAETHALAHKIHSRGQETGGSGLTDHGKCSCLQTSQKHSKSGKKHFYFSTFPVDKSDPTC